MGQDRSRVFWSRCLTSPGRKANLLSVSRNDRLAMVIRRRVRSTSFSLLPAEVRRSWEASSELLGLVGEHMQGQGVQTPRV